MSDFDIRKAMKTEPPIRLDDFDQYISKFAKSVLEQVDAACLLALESGKCGVKVITSVSDGSMVIQVTEEVPFGEIHYHMEDGPAAYFGPL